MMRWKTRLGLLRINEPVPALLDGKDGAILAGSVEIPDYLGSWDQAEFY